MGINDVARQIQAEQTGWPNSRPRQEQSMDQRPPGRGALAQPQRATLMSSDQKLVALGTTIIGLLAVNTALLTLLLVSG